MVAWAFTGIISDEATTQPSNISINHEAMRQEEIRAVHVIARQVRGYSTTLPTISRSMFQCFLNDLTSRESLGASRNSQSSAGASLGVSGSTQPRKDGNSRPFPCDFGSVPWSHAISIKS